MKLRKAEDMTMDSYYAEQEELLSGPIETVEEYRQRMADMIGQSQSARIFADSGSSYRLGRASSTQWKTSDVDTLSSSTGRNIKRKASEPQLETAGKRKKITDPPSALLDQEMPSTSQVVSLHDQARIDLPLDQQVPPNFGDLNLKDVNLPVLGWKSDFHQPDTCHRAESSPLAEIQLSKDSSTGLLPPSLTIDITTDSKGEIENFDVNPGPSSAQGARIERVGLSPTCGPQVNETTTLLKRSSQMPDDPLDEIDSFTVEVNTPIMLDAKQRVRAVRQPQTTAEIISPISSFSRIEDIAQRCEPQVVWPSAQLPLHLHPIAEVERPPNRKKLISEGVPPHSPIDDVSVVPHRVLHSDKVVDKKQSSIQPSKAQEDPETPNAQHETSGRRDKVLPKHVSTRSKSESFRSTSSKLADDPDVILVSSSPSSRASSPATAPLSETDKAVQRLSVKLPPNKRKSKSKPAKPQPMTPFEYAQMLQLKAAENTSLEAKANKGSSSNPVPQKKKSITVKFLDGKNIFYTGGDMKNATETTRGRMKIITKFGGSLVPQFDPKITTHIITDASVAPTLRALGLKNLKQIPGHIPTVKWSWVLSVIGKETSLSKDEIKRKLDDTWLHAAFSERMDAGYLPQKTVSLASFKDKAKARAPSDQAEPLNPAQMTHSNKTPELKAKALKNTMLSAPVSPAASPLTHLPPLAVTKDFFSDPLAEFYNVARFDQLKEDGWSSLGEVDETGDDSDDDERPGIDHGGVKSSKRVGWTCDSKPEVPAACPNQDIIDKLTELMQLHKAKVGNDDHWRAFSYNKSIRALKSHPQRIKTYEEARAIKGVGEKTARKIEEILDTGDLRRIRYEKTEDVAVTSVFQGIYGVGQSTAMQWFAAGCRSLDDLRMGKGGVKLSTVQQIGLRHYDDINTRMPRAEAKAIFDLIKPIALSIDSKIKIEIMGSYRRGKQTCGDIDVLLTRPTEDGQTHHGVLPRLLHALHQACILTEDLAIPDDPKDLEAVYRGLCKIPDLPSARQRRIDFLCVPWASRGAALIYYTGDDIFNRAMRYKANAMGYSLNQRGLFGNVVRDPHDRRVKFNDGVLIASETEEEIFKVLDVPWQEPHERIRG